MDYQSNNQSGDPQNTGTPYNNTTNSGNPYNDTPVNNENPYGDTSANTTASYDNDSRQSGNSYGNLQNDNTPYGGMPNNGNPYGNAPASNGSPYGNNTYSNGNPYNNMANGQNPYGNAANNGNPYGNSPYNNTNPYHNPYNNRNPYPNPYYNGNPYGSIGAKIVSPQKTKGEGMATAAMILGIISLISLLLLHIYIPFLVGGVGIILAVLSKGKAKKMIGKAKAGLICCITGLALDVTLCVFSVYLVFALPDIMPEMVDEVNKMCEEQYGMTYEELMDEIYEMWDIEP